MRLTRNKLKLLNPAIQSAVALLVLSGGNVVHAQEATGAPPVASAEEGVNKVVVTARRREETLQDVPVSVTAFSADQLSKTATPDITALALALPNTTLKSSRATNSTLTAFIRGVGQADPLAGFESGVGIYIDDIYLARPQAAVADIYDVERIEVLRGPQGTLYGRNTIGGAVKYVTRKLAPQPDARIRATVGEYGQAEVVATASTPVSETARIGGTIARFNRDGFGKNLTTGGDNYDKDVSAARLSAEFTPTPDLFIRIAGDYTQDDSSPRNGHRLTVGRTSGAPILSNVFDTRANLMRALNHDQQVKAHGVSATVEYQMNSDWSFKSITASRKDKSYAPIDFDSLAVVDMEVPALYTNKQFSQEFNLTYTGDRLQGVAGVYYIDANAFNKFDTILGGAVPTSTYTMGDVDTKAWAIYADGSYNVTDAFSVSLGGRYTVDKREAEVLRQIYLGANGSPGLGNAGAVLFRTDTDLRGGQLKREDKKFTPRIALNYKINPDHNVYASYSEGFKGGGFDPRLNVVGTRIPLSVARAGYAPETIETYELGLKSAFNGGRITTNAAVFFSDYQDVQIPGSVAIDTNGDGRDDSFAGVTTNAGKAKIKGAELEAIANITPNFMIAGMYSYIDAEYKEYFAGGVNVAAQRTFQNTPRNSANLRFNYDIPMAIAGYSGKWSLIGSASYKGATAQFETASALDQESYKLYDASIVWTRLDGKVRAGLHGKNLSDKHYRTGGYLFPTLGNEGTLTAFYGNPRQISATLEYRF
ncbi:TonB-dependent receptor [Massilia sp. IC2-477]|uniref:TonB-dependent receptor n=1 Tax=unclassified Massilia TaxID=2609279 RepID=UPI001D0F9AE8|nr:MULTISPECIES: TonB-dependent receptor [unclassified Massilia]MCC2956318.1 TonB-dependent receptor [Massilia sp. IC2-477]MCC2972311.1 TonB-dependent receptor [Massilia sp. IC2-476]